ncbi:hypothetical protein [Hamadaea tsunoensis]|uniref:hypothetical protein n=1 Tax=Hamadaea tsunoensis TaxID=53368 RepID=UPI00041A051D|nr:hypothetical protein [Hamadaea tsunoensis]
MTTTDRARRRAVRALAERAGIAYSEARRQLERGVGPDEILATSGRTIYRDTLDLRPFAVRLAEVREAADVPAGRAAHLVRRFPESDGLYAARPDVLADAYRAVDPQLVPADLGWVAELAEATAVDQACAGLDRAARRVLGDDPARLGEAQVLDAVLVVGDDGHAPGTPVRVLPTGAYGLILTACWGPAGPPFAYLVSGTAGRFEVAADDLAVRPD